MSTQIDFRHTEALAVALDCVSTSIFLAHTDGCIVHCNIAGSRMLNHGGALKQLFHSRLTACRSSEARDLNAVLSRVFERQQPELLRFSSRNGPLRLLIKVNPVPGDALVAVCVVDLQATEEDLTPLDQGDAQLSPQKWGIRRGPDKRPQPVGVLRSESRDPGVTRTRLKKLFAQTGRSSQAALVSVPLRATTIAPPQADGKLTSR